MADNSSIEWTDTTWNPLAGCTRASAGCDNCYAAVMALRLEAMARADLAAGKDPGAKRKYIGTATRTPSGRVAFNGTINLDEGALREPLSWRKPRRVFVNSMSDLFHKDVPFAFVDKVFDVMIDTPQHTYQVLTKRPERMAEYVRQRSLRMHWKEPPPNIWLGTSVEDQAAADARIPYLLRTPARVRFLSCEPLLGPVMLRRWLRPSPGWAPSELHWVIVGGESGPGARPMHPQWVRDLRDECQAAGDVSFFFKQWGEWYPFGKGYIIANTVVFPEKGYIKDWSHRDFTFDDGRVVRSRADMHTFDADKPMYQTVYKVGKPAAGRLLDGREWNEVPA